MKPEYIQNFEKLGMGLFVHFGLFSTAEKGEWMEVCCPDFAKQIKPKLVSKFKIKKNWAKDLVKFAKKIGAKYITLTTRHHEGFSLFDTRGLNDFDAPHSPTKRDLIKEFVDECNKGGIVPFFYHTLLDWYNPDYNTNFPRYIDYLVNSVEILCKNYGKVGGFWFDGFWSKPNENWQFDRLYGMIRKYQPDAMIINNTGLGARGTVGHKEIDSVTFERGHPVPINNEDGKDRAGEMCDGINDHWGYAKNDINYKSIKHLLNSLITCRYCNCNYLINTGLKGDGSIALMDKALMLEIGTWIRANKNFIYNVKKADIEAENARVLKDDEGNYYAVIENIPMNADQHVVEYTAGQLIEIKTDKKIVGAKYLDNNEKVKFESKNSFKAKAFYYGNSMYARVVKFKLK